MFSASANALGMEFGGESRYIGFNKIDIKKCIAVFQLKNVRHRC